MLSVTASTILLSKFLILSPQSVLQVTGRVQEFCQSLPLLQVPLPGPPPFPANSQHSPSTQDQQTPSNGTAAPRKRRNRWGPAGTDDAAQAASQATTSGQPEGEAPKRKRKSRWEEPDASKELSVVSNMPKEITLPGGIKVRFRLLHFLSCLVN